MVVHCLEGSSSEHLLIFTDGSIDSDRNSATAVAIILALGYECAGKFSFATTSTTGELAALRLTLQQLLLLRSPGNPQEEVFLKLQSEERAGMYAREIASLCHEAEEAG